MTTPKSRTTQCRTSHRQCHYVACKFYDLCFWLQKPRDEEWCLDFWDLKERSE